MRKSGIVLIGIMCALFVCGCKENIIIESDSKTGKDTYLEKEEQDTYFTDNDVYTENDNQTEESCASTSNVYGVWEITEYIGRGIDSQADDIYEEIMQTDWEAYREERELLVGQKLEIEQDVLKYCLPSGEREGEYCVNSYEGMFFGYKPPIQMEVTYQVERFYVEWKEDASSAYIILDREGIAVVDIEGDFYYIKYIEGNAENSESRISEQGQYSTSVETGNDSSEEIEFLIGSNEASVVMMEQEFFDMIEENPIDKEMQWEECGSINRISLACKYRDAWIVEIENSLAILKEYLTEEDYLLLEESYEGWKQYMDNTTSLEQQLFYVGTSYTQEGTGLVTGDNASYPYTMEIAAERTKHYAIQLKSLGYALTGTIEFAYKKAMLIYFPLF